MLVATYLANLVCGVIKCPGFMNPPEAYIADYENASDLTINEHSNPVHNLNYSKDFGQNAFGERKNAFGDVLPVVHFKHGGALEGYYMGTLNGRKIAAYEGIPYAEAPIGELRFKSPVPNEPWKGIRKSQKTRSPCLQTHPLHLFFVTGDEDCLFANVYSVKIPYKTDSKLYPVLIYIHGGMFIFGSGNEYGPSYLLDQDIILVTFNYRLGPLGFLSTGDLESPGNYGLKDQALLIKWVHENIQRFGGDPSRISLAGQSAGGVSSHLHLIANKVSHCFQTGMSLSGSAFGFVSLLNKEGAEELTAKLARRLNCSYKSSSQLLKCLRGLSGTRIVMAHLQLYSWLPLHPFFLIAPVVEPEGPDSYLTTWPQDAYQKGEVEAKPWIFGETLKEGHFETYILRAFKQLPNKMYNFNEYLPKILHYEYFSTEMEKARITEKLMEFYSSKASNSSFEIDVISDMYTDRYFSNGIRKSIQAHSVIAPRKTFAYVFDFIGKYNLGELFGVPRSEWSSAHTEDILMVFNSTAFHHGLSKRDLDYKLTEIMTNVLVNFVASSGIPSYRDSNGTIVELWDNAIDRGDIENIYEQGQGQDYKLHIVKYLQFGTTVGMTSDPFYSRIKFWQGLGIPL